MRQRIRRAIQRVRACLLPQDAGRHRTTSLTLGVHGARVLYPVQARSSAVTDRLLDAPLEGDAHALVRPYVVAAEQAARRAALALALDGMDAPGPYVIDGMEVPGC